MTIQYGKCTECSCGSFLYNCYLLCSCFICCFSYIYIYIFIYLFIICISIFIFFLIHPLHIHAEASVLPVSLVDSVTAKVGNKERSYQPTLCKTHIIYILYTLYIHFVCILHIFRIDFTYVFVLQLFGHVPDMFQKSFGGQKWSFSKKFWGPLGYHLASSEVSTTRWKKLKNLFFSKK